MASFSDRLEMTSLALEDAASRILQPPTCRFLVATLDAPIPDGTPELHG